jgi:hypothetical protein
MCVGHKTFIFDKSNLCDFFPLCCLCFWCHFQENTAQFKIKEFYLKDFFLRFYSVSPYI